MEKKKIVAGLVIAAGVAFVAGVVTELVKIHEQKKAEAETFPGADETEEVEAEETEAPAEGEN